MDLHTALSLWLLFFCALVAGACVLAIVEAVEHIRADRRHARRIRQIMNRR